MNGVIADDVDQRRRRPPAVVQVGDAVTEAGAEVQQRRRRPAGHASVAVGRAAADTFEQNTISGAISGTASMACTKCISEVPDWRSRYLRRVRARFG